MDSEDGSFDAMSRRLIAVNPAPDELKQAGRIAVRAFRGLQDHWSDELEVGLVESGNESTKLFAKIWTAAYDLVVEARKWPLNDDEALELDEAIDEVIYFWFTLSYLLQFSEDTDWDHAMRAMVGDIASAFHDQTVIDRCIRRWCWISSVFVSLYASTADNLEVAIENAERLHRVLVATGFEDEWLSPDQLRALPQDFEESVAARERIVMELVFVGSDALLSGVVSYESTDRTRAQLSGLWLDALLIQAQEFGAARSDRLSSLGN